MNNNINSPVINWKELDPNSTLAWKIPWTEEPRRLQSMGSLRVGHNWVTSFNFSLSCIGEGNGNPLQCSCLENPRDGGAWWAAVYGVAQSQTRLKWLSSSSSSSKFQHLSLFGSLCRAHELVLTVPSLSSIPGGAPHKGRGGAGFCAVTELVLLYLESHGLQLLH